MPYIPDGDLLSSSAAERSRRKTLLFAWSLAVAFLLGAPAAYLVANRFEVRYKAQGSLWIEGFARQTTTDGPTPEGRGQGEDLAWMELIHSRRVLEAAVMDERLYVEPPVEYADAFASFIVAEEFVPGRYRLSASQQGGEFLLSGGEGDVMERGALGAPVGESLGFIWTPPVASFPPGTRVELTVLSLRDAAEGLSRRLTASVDREGGLLRLGLSGSDPVEASHALNAVMQHLLDLAAELKRGKLRESEGTLESQLQAVELELKRASGELEEFWVAKSGGSTDGAPAPPEDRAEEVRLKRRVEVAERLYTDLRGRLVAAQGSRTQGVADVRILDRAPVPARREDPSVLAALAVFLGCVAAALGGALILERMVATSREDS